MLLGTYEGRLDAQARLVIPLRLRGVVEGGMFLSVGIDACIEVYPREEWERHVAAEIRGLSRYRKDARTMRRLTLARAFEGRLDKQGRVVVPEILRNYAGITDNVVIAGQDAFFEVWSPERWVEQLARESSLSDIAETLGKSNA